MAAHRAKKSGTKKARKSTKGKKRGSTTWTRFCKAHPGHTTKTLSRMYRAAGHGKKKVAKKGKRKGKAKRKAARKGHKKAR